MLKAVKLYTAVKGNSILDRYTLLSSTYFLRMNMTLKIECMLWYKFNLPKGKEVVLRTSRILMYPAGSVQGNPE